MTKKTLSISDRIHFVEFKLLKGQIDSPEEFDEVEKFSCSMDFQLGFNFDDSLVKADLTVNVNSESEGKNAAEAGGLFHFMYIYRITGLSDFAILKDDEVEVEDVLANTLASISYSTSRGVLLTRLQGTALQNFILPVVNPNVLLGKDTQAAAIK